MRKPVQLFRPEDYHSLTDFQRNAREHIRRLRRTGRPLVLTLKGRASVVVQDAQVYRALVELAEQMETLLAVRDGLDSVARKKGIPLERFDREFRARHGLSNRRRSTGTG